MLWRDPLYLWLLLAVIAVGGALLVLLRRRAAALRAFVEAPLVERLTPQLDPRRPLWRTLLRVAALGLIVVALAGPKWGFHWQEVKRQGIDVIVALDTSRSMLATDVKPDRLERAKLAILDLLPRLQGDRIGLVAFAGTAFLECPLTVDYAAFERSLRSVEVGIIPRGGTALARAIDISLEGFDARQGKYEALILITDGEDHEGDLKAAAQRAVDHGVKVYTVGIGTPDGELIPAPDGGFVKDRSGQVVKSRLDDVPLKEVALATGGAYVQGLGPGLGLDEVFQDHIAKMERREVASALERRYEDRFQLPLAAAVALLIIEWLVPLRRTPRRGSWRKSVAAGSMALCLPLLVGFFDPPGDRAAEGNQLYADGKYEDAASKYGEGLIDAPASPLLEFNLTTALYKQGKYDDALAALNKLAANGDPAWTAPVAYNMGNIHFRLGAGAETTNPQQALQSWEQALADYKRAMVADAADENAKFNHEFVSRRIDELKKKLEEQQKQKEEKEQQKQEQQQQDQQKQDQGQQDQPQESQKPQDQQQGEQGGEPQPAEDQPQAQQQPGEDQQPGEQQQGQPEPDQAGGEPQQAHQPQQVQGDATGEPQQAQGGGTTVDGETDDPKQQAARAVLDTARGEELGPEDIQRPAGVAGVGEAGQDW